MSAEVAQQDPAHQCHRERAEAPRPVRAQPLRRTRPEGEPVQPVAMNPPAAYLLKGMPAPAHDDEETER